MSGTRKEEALFSRAMEMHAQADFKVKRTIYTEAFSETAITVDVLYFTSEPVLEESW